MNKVYNVGAYGIPKVARSQVEAMNLMLTWSAHAKHAVVEDKHGVLHSGAYPREFIYSTRPWELVEVETNSRGAVVKFVVRLNRDDFDVVLVILRDGPHDGIVKTCWLNTPDDRHVTLDWTKFSKP